MSEINKELLKLLASPIVGFLFGLLAYNYQFKKNNKFLYKNRVRHLLNLVKETLSDSLSNLEYRREFIKDIHSKFELSIPKHTGYNIHSILKEKVTDENYYIATTYIFKGNLKSVAEFDKLRRSAVKLNQQFESIDDLINQAVKENHINRIRFLELFTESRKIMGKHIQENPPTAENPQGTGNTPLFISTGYDKIISKFIELLASKNQVTIEEIQEIFVKPSNNFFKGKFLVGDIYSYSMMLSEMSFIYSNTIANNKKIEAIISSMLINTTNLLKEINRINGEYNDVQVSKFWK
ncbi:MAG TPA: hypothetical protein VL098_12610 [Flavipsychrobacter sp.]|nr:hypothetical protein [Flavipsychrobacter sp.]